jgi:hypothetical protein
LGMKLPMNAILGTRQLHSIFSALIAVFICIFALRVPVVAPRAAESILLGWVWGQRCQEWKRHNKIATRTIRRSHYLDGLKI